MGAISFLVLKGGLLAVTPSPEANAPSQFEHANEIMWLIAFAAGFSDRFSDKILRALIGRFGGDPSDELVSVRSPTRSSAIDLLPDPQEPKSEVAAIDKSKSANEKGQTGVGLKTAAATNGTGK